MIERVDQMLAYEVPAHLEPQTNAGRDDVRSRTKHTSRTRAATLVIGVLCSVVTLLAIDPVADRNLLFEQYDFKLWSHDDRLVVFCLSVMPRLVGMGVLIVAYKTINGLRSILFSRTSIG